MSVKLMLDTDEVLWKRVKIFKDKNDCITLNQTVVFLLKYALDRLELSNGNGGVRK